MIEIGLERFVREQSESRTVRGRVGLLMNRASVDSEVRLASERVDSALPGALQCIFTPQHGWWGEQQANMIETPHSHGAPFEVPVYSLYSTSRRPTDEMLQEIDYLLIDLQDVGVRVYTFIWTMLYCLEACRGKDIQVVVLDRPNPLGGQTIEGPLLTASCRSFVGEAEIPMRHGLTIGEMARWLVDARKLDVNLTVIPMQGWSRDQFYRDIARVWIPPSPNLPSPNSAMAYPGQVLLEGVNLSEGRGLTTPFEVIGAPFLNPIDFLAAAVKLGLPGVRFLPIRFTPSFDKWAGQSCGGVSIHIVDPLVYRSYRMTVELLRIAQQLAPDSFSWLDPPYEYEETLPPIDIISGGSQLREGLEDRPIEELVFVDTEGWFQSTANARMY